VGAIDEWIARQVGAARLTFFAETLRNLVPMHGRFPQPLPLMASKILLDQAADDNVLSSTPQYSLRCWCRPCNVRGGMATDTQRYRVGKNYQSAPRYIGEVTANSENA
jgi:hypothetical protein